MVDEERGALSVSIPPLGGIPCCSCTLLLSWKEKRRSKRAWFWQAFLDCVGLWHQAWAWHAFDGTALASVALAGLRGHLKVGCRAAFGWHWNSQPAPCVMQLPLDPGDSGHYGGPPQCELVYTGPLSTFPHPPPPPPHGCSGLPFSIAPGKNLPFGGSSTSITYFLFPLFLCRSSGESLGTSLSAASSQQNWALHLYRWAEFWFRHVWVEWQK